MLKPKLFTLLKNLPREQMLKDINSGIIVGIIALPLAIAFAIASGVSPERGIITAIIGGFLVSFLGGSRVQIGGPTGAFIVIIYGIVQNYGVDGLMVATVMAGVILVIMGFAKFGSVIKFIPHPVTVGFTSGIALIIFSTQINDFFGLGIQKVPSEFIDKWDVYIANFGSVNYYAAGISVVSLLIIVFWNRITHKVPGSLVAIVLSTVYVSMLDIPVATIGSVFGEISGSIPLPQFPKINFEIIKAMIQPATTIALLAAIEALLSAVVSDGMIGGRHRSNMELIAQGTANIASPLFGGIPVTGAIARTAANVKNGGRSPIAGMVHAVVLLLILLFVGQYAALIPLAALSAVLVVVAYNMSEWRSFMALLKSPRSDIIVLLTTFFLTVIFDLTIAIEVGIVLAVFLFMRRMASVTNVEVIRREFSDEDDKSDPNSIEKKEVPHDVEVYEINGPFFFGATTKFQEALRESRSKPKILIIRMRNVPVIDASGIHTIEQVWHDSKKEGIEIIFSGVHTQPLFAFTQAGFLDTVGEKNFYGNIDDALDRAREILGLAKKGRGEDFTPDVEREKRK